ncbi:MAG: diguanylate cyclase [Kofleriaceae bacterium]|jgi:two-component system cell cycle response regulator|nr:diguanylate cyclase [Kofleriaceae bacterium]MBP6838609.1 diguanylate cyclase [Kofleriaceae bacterium]MBP9203540.1 diguanylate cyclase [Kofleriaceae bacterium]
MSSAHRLLCVDDEPVARRAMARVLGALPGVEVDEASNLAEARDLLASRSYAVVLTDHAMPGGSGLELLEFLAEHHPDVPSILVTGVTETELALAAVNRGRVWGLLHKPWRREELVLAANQAIERSELRSKLVAQVAELEAANRRLEHVNAMLVSSRGEVDRLAKLAATDDKTGLRSHRFFVERLDEELARAQRYGHTLTVALIDLDGFKAVNDRHGHLAGDRVLREVADLLSASLRLMDVVARFGGDEFALLLPDTNLAGAAILGERLRVLVAATALGASAPGEVTLSMGLAAVPDHRVDSAAALLELADAALYAAKQGGRNRFVVAEAAPTH